MQGRTAQKNRSAALPDAEALRGNQEHLAERL